jgi:two-component system response regulator FixJ
VAPEIEDLQTRFNALSARQRQVMELAVAGLVQQGVGIDISTKPVENHGAWIMKRTRARNLAELIRMAMELGNSKR